MLATGEASGSLVNRQHDFQQSRRFATSQTVAGQTAHVGVYTDGSADGNAAAQAVLNSCEADFAAVRG